MPAISRIRFTNVIYENGGKRYNDEIFLFDGHNSAFLLENGGGKTVFIQAALQAIIPHISMAERKIKDTLSLENAPAHIAIEWIINDKPRRYAMTAVSLYIENNALNSYKYTYDYDAQDGQGIEDIPFSVTVSGDKKRPATRGEMGDYYSRMNKQSMHANVFSTIQDYGKYIENTYKIIPSEWRKVATINSSEGNVDEFFSKCKTTEQLLSNLLIPVVEEAIEGDHTIGFVETFERQREHFKKNRILQDKITESRRIKEKIDAYVEVYKSYEDERIELAMMKQEAKTVTNYVKNQLITKNQELGLNEENQQVLKKDFRTFEQEQKSFDLYLLREQIKDAKSKMITLTDSLVEEQARLDTLAARKQNIEMTVIGKEIEAEEAHIRLLEEELDQIESEVEIEDIKKQLAENSSNIKGQFVYDLELIDREIVRINNALNQLGDKETHLKEKLATSLAYEKDLIGQRSQLEASISMIERNVSRLENQLFGEGPRVAINLHRDSVTTRIKQLAKEKNAYETRLDELRQYISTKTKAHENLVEQKVQVKEHMSVAREQLKVLEGKMDVTIMEVEAAGYPLYMTGNIYSKEASILNELEEQREQAFNLKEKAIRHERINLRQFDAYEDLSHYMSEPLLESIVLELKENLDYIELGSQFIESVKSSYNLTSEDLFERYPLWSVTLVTSVKHLHAVRKSLDSYSDRLNQLVLVLSREEANKLAQGQSDLMNELTSRAVFPQEWQIGLEPERYFEWQQALRSMANASIEGRKEKESALVKVDRLLGSTRAFFQAYPYDLYDGLKGDVAGYETTMKQVNADLIALDRAIKEDQDSLMKVTGLLGDLNLEAQSLDSAFRLVEQVAVEERSILHKEGQLSVLLDTFNELVMQMEHYGFELEKVVDEVKNTEHELRKFSSEKEKVITLVLYEEVKDYEPYGTNTSLESLKEHRQQLKNKLAGICRSQVEIEARVNEHRNLKQRYEHELAKKTHEATYVFTRIEAYYEGEEEALFDRMKTAENSLDQLRSQVHRGEKSITEISTRAMVIEESLDKEFGGFIQFDIESHHIEQRLRVEKATLNDRSRKLIKEKKSIEALVRKYDLTYRELEIKDGSFHYMAVDVVPLNLEVDYFDGFEDTSETSVHGLLNSLEGQFTLTQKQLSLVRSEEASVMQFCRNNIKDRRLMETLSIGLNSKGSYQELLIYQEKMTEIITKIIKVAEDDRRESDLELQTFLSHLMTYVKSVASELDVIQKKTKITVDEEVKQIFVFDIPVWDEEVAKRGLRHYIDETILYYEKESLHEGVTEESLRRSLSDRLSVMSLLDVVMEEQSIKIKCRKVTNDMRINKLPMNWESSNKWSGGEKWSKNMTLFLSLLNYLAEKKQHLSPHQKKQRSVILDNPFGKASSNHVLKPVFMIAEKLGFQIIALTAHAEGKFISDYFPVVYSCRLRKTKDPVKQVMTKEKILNHTYLREHAPMTIMRMQEIEQISLF